MPFQDDARENRIVDLFNLERPVGRVRHGTDAVLRMDDQVLEFELKSVPVGRGLTTVRDFGPDHIAKWKDKHWIVAVYSGIDLLHCKYGSPASMAPWIEEKWRYIEGDFNLAKNVPERIDLETMRSILGTKDLYTLADAKKLHKKQHSAYQYRERMDVVRDSKNGPVKIGYSPQRMLEITRDRARYVIERGSTLNNPHIPPAYYSEWDEISRDHASRLRELVRAWLSANAPEANVPLPAQHDTP